MTRYDHCPRCGNLWGVEDPRGVQWLEWTCYNCGYREGGPAFNDERMVIDEGDPTKQPFTGQETRRITYD